MTEIEIKFNKWSKDKLIHELKCATSRNKKYGDVGDTFEVVFDDLKVIHKYKLQMVIKLPLWFIASELFKSEGCKTSSEFKEVWCDIYPRKGWVDEQVVWYYYFGEI